MVAVYVCISPATKQMAGYKNNIRTCGENKVTDNLHCRTDGEKSACSI